MDISKKRFIEMVELIRDHRKSTEAFINGLQSAVDGFPVFTMDGPLFAVIGMLWPDYHDWVEWWLYEANGIEGDLTHDWFEKDGCVDEPLAFIVYDPEKDITYAPRNSGELWEMLQSFKEEK